MLFSSTLTREGLATLVVVLLYVGLRLLMARLVLRYARSSQIMEKRARLVLKYLNFLLTWLVMAALVLIWGIRKKDILLALSSITTVIGVAMFAQWSILSNITSGIIVFFFFPYRIGDTIKILDKDFPVEGFIEDISAFHLTLRTTEGERVTYPNNLLLQKGVAVVGSSKNIPPFED